MTPKIIFEDEDLLVLDKPAGMTVNRSDTTKDEQTVQDFVKEHLNLPASNLQIFHKLFPTAVECEALFVFSAHEAL